MTPLPILSAASLVGFGAVVAALPAFEMAAVISACTLDALPHNGAVVTMLAIRSCTHRESDGAIVMPSILGALLALRGDPGRWRGRELLAPPRRC